MTTEAKVVESPEKIVKIEQETEQPSKDFLEIFEQLDPTINGELIEKAWKLYDTISQQVNIDLEQPKKVWMACAFYTTVWMSTPIGQETVYKFSVSKLLSICNLSVLEFFEKLNKWAAMIVASRRLLDHLNRVQSNLAVSTVVYKKFLPIFRKVFVNANPEESINKSKYATQPFSSLDIAHLFEFIWIAYIALKKQLGNSNEDLMHSYHLLLCIIELIFENIQSVGLTRMYNADFAKTLETNDVTALEYFCETFEGVILDAKHFRTHWLKPKLKKLHDEGLILRDCNLKDNSNSFIFLGDFRNNRNAFEKLYEEAMLKRAEVDERILISSAVANIETVFNDALDASAITLLKRCNLDSSWAIDAELLLRMSTQACLEKLSSSRPVPPSSQANAPTKTFVMGEQFCPVMPILEADKRVQKLQNLLMEDFRNSENEFDRLLSECAQNPKIFIADRIRILQTWFEEKMEEDKKIEGDHFDEEFNNVYNVNNELIPMLFYRILQRAVMYDRERNLMNGVDTTNDLGTILFKEDFIGSLWICAVELVLFTYSSQREFPWSASMARVAPVNFYKIVELVVRSEPELSRDMIKHLNKVEERVIEELAWAIDSPLWGALAKYSSQGVPSCRSVALTTTAFNTRQDMPYYQGGSNHMGGVSTFSSRYNSSPMKPYEQRGIPIKRRFEENNYDDIEMGSVEDEIIQPRTKRHIPEDFPEDFASNDPAQVEKELPSSLTLFFRKVYYLAVIRISDLCDRIRMEEATRQKVWTLFEHLLRVETSIMAGRHLDQNLMCCVYIVAKICGSETAFQDILYNYRHQPQAVSRIYRCVLMESSISPPNVVLSDDGASRDSITSVSGGKFRSNSVLPPPGTASAPPTPEPHNLDYNDLIKYYNRVFVGRVEEFVKKLNPSNVDSKENIIALNPMPKVSCNTLSPRRLINEQINLIPYTASNTLQGRPARYNINRSPSKDLKNINAMVRGAHISQQMMSHEY